MTDVDYCCLGVFGLPFSTAYLSGSGPPVSADTREDTAGDVVHFQPWNFFSRKLHLVILGSHSFP